MLQGDLYYHESMVKAIKQEDVVISTVGPQQLADQVKIIATIKEAGSVKVCISKLLKLDAINCIMVKSNFEPSNY